MSMVNLLAGDVGGTTTRLGLFERTASRPHPVAVRQFATLDFPDLRSMIAAFLDAAPRAELSKAPACFGVAGPVSGDAASLTNTPWPRMEADVIARAFGLSHVRLLNDLEAMAYAVPLLEPHEVHVLQEGRPAAVRRRATSRSLPRERGSAKRSCIAPTDAISRSRQKPAMRTSRPARIEISRCCGTWWRATVARRSKT